MGSESQQWGSFHSLLQDFFILLSSFSGSNTPELINTPFTCVGVIDALECAARREGNTGETLRLTIECYFGCEYWTKRTAHNKYTWHHNDYMVEREFLGGGLKFVSLICIKYDQYIKS